MTSPSEDIYEIEQTASTTSDLKRKIVLRTRALKLDPAHSLTYFNWAIHLLKQRQYQKAKKKWKKAIQIVPDRSILYSGWMGALYEEREFEEVILLIERYPERFANILSVPHAKGKCFFYLEDYENAIKCFQKVIKDNKYFLAYHFWALALFLQGNIKEAFEVLEKANQIHKFPQLTYEREIVLLEEDLKREGSKGFEDIIKKLKAFKYILVLMTENNEKNVVRRDKKVFCKTNWRELTVWKVKRNKQSIEDE